MRVLSLFDGISCCRVALERAEIEVETYYASEIDKHAIAISKKNYPDIVQLGSVVGLTPPENIDLLIGGSPCQDLSIAKKDRKGLDGERSGLFWEYVRIKDECKPTYFILENVASMPKKDRDIITTTLGVQPVLFNASLVSAQCRKRLFWTNLKFELPEDRGILLKDILQPDAEVDERMVVDGKAFCLTASYQGAIESNSVERRQRTMVKLAVPKQNEFIQIGYFGAENHCKVGGQALRVYDASGKSTTSGIGLYQSGNQIRKLTPIECERLQSLPDNYTEGIAKTHRYKCLGNAFNVNVVSHILSVLHNE